MKGVPVSGERKVQSKQERTLLFHSNTEPGKGQKETLIHIDSNSYWWSCPYLPSFSNWHLFSPITHARLYPAPLLNLCKVKFFILQIFINCLWVSRLWRYQRKQDTAQKPYCQVFCPNNLSLIFVTQSNTVNKLFLMDISGALALPAYN